ncbi:MAG: hypothetical protein ACLTSG_06015 [Lachnospiraceae bacterium]
MQSIDRSYYESAILDGAGWLPARAKYITIPDHAPHHCTGCHYHGVYDLQAVRRCLPADAADRRAKHGSGFHTILTYAYENAFIEPTITAIASAISMIIFLHFCSLFSAKFQLKEDA